MAQSMALVRLLLTQYKYWYNQSIRTVILGDLTSFSVEAIKPTYRISFTLAQGLPAQYQL